MSWGIKFFGLQEILSPYWACRVRDLKDCVTPISSAHTINFPHISTHIHTHKKTNKINMCKNYNTCINQVLQPTPWYSSTGLNPYDLSCEAEPGIFHKTWTSFSYLTRCLFIRSVSKSWDLDSELSESSSLSTNDKEPAQISKQYDNSTHLGLVSRIDGLVQERQT